MNLNKPGIYIVSGGALKTGYKKIGKTTNIGGLRDRYNTVYGESCKIEYCLDDDIDTHEQEIHTALNEHHIENELFNVNQNTAKNVCKEITGAKTMKKI